MISEITVRPKPKNKNAYIICAVFLILAVAVVVVYSVVPYYRGVVGLGAVAMIAAAIYVYTKYVGVQYAYEVALTDGGAMLLIRQTVGKRSTLLCDVYLSSIRSVCRETREERRAHKTPEGTQRYVFTPTVFPDEVYRITASRGADSREIVIECNEEFASLLLGYAEEARAELDEE